MERPFSSSCGGAHADARLLRGRPSGHAAGVPMFCSVQQSGTGRRLETWARFTLSKVEVVRLQEARLGSQALELVGVDGAATPITVTGLDRRHNAELWKFEPGDLVRIAGLRSAGGSEGALTVGSGGWVQIARRGPTRSVRQDCKPENQREFRPWRRARSVRRQNQRPRRTAQYRSRLPTELGPADLLCPLTEVSGAADLALPWYEPRGA